MMLEKLKLKTMKKNKLNVLFILMLMVMIALVSCESNNDSTPQAGSILPESFSVDIPNAISNDGSINARYYSTARTNGDTLQGNDIYEHLGNFISIGEGAGEIVEELIFAIRVYQINRPMVLSYESDEDGRVKNLIVVENSEFDGITWEFQLTISDAESEGNADGGKGLQVFWNRSPVRGIALIKPYNTNRNDDGELEETIFRIDYSEGGEHGYDAHMIVSIANFPEVDPLEDPYAVDGLKMFAGRKGDVVDVYGNSNHPNAIFFAGDVGFNWAFVASGDDSEDIGVAEVGLPPSSLDEPSRDVLLDFYSIKNVFTREINAVWPGLDPEILEAYLMNTEGPGYFDSDGFISGGTSPGEDWDVLAERLQLLSPYNPKDISNLTLEFK